MRYFLDTEFIENGKTIELISLAIAQFPPDVREAWQDRARQYNLPQQFIDNI